MSRFVRGIGLCLFALVASLLAAPPAQATSALLGPVLWPLPAGATDGGSGTPALNALLASTCGAPAGRGDVEWFTLPTRNLGTVYAKGRSWTEMYAYLPIVDPARTALVDYVNGVVLSCTGGPTTITTAHPTAVAVWPTESSIVGPCSVLTEPCNVPRYLDVYVGTTSGRPANDNWASATTVPSLPYSGSGDRSVATTDAPSLADSSCRGIYSFDAANVWFRYTATTSGNLPISAQGGVISAGTSGPSGPQFEPMIEGACSNDGGAIQVTAGSTYYVSVSTDGGDRYCGSDECYLLSRTGRYTVNLGPVGAPLVPEAFTVVSGATGAATLTWLLPQQVAGTGAVTGFRVSRDGTDAAGTGPVTLSLGSGARSYTFTGLRPSTSYTFSVRGVNAAGVGVPSNASVITQPAPTAPSTAAGSVDAVVNATTRTAVLSWTPASSTGSATITGYRVARDGTDSGGGGPWSTTVPASSTSQTFTLLRPSALYRFSVTPLTSAGDGPMSWVQAYVLSAPVAPGRPTQVQWDTTATPTSLVLRWKPPRSDGESPITGYRIARNGTDSGSSGAYATTLPATARSFTLTSLNGWFPYSLTVQAINAAGTGVAASGMATLETDTAGPPTGVTAVRGNARATIGWTAPANAGNNGPVTGYRIRTFAGATRTLLSTATVSATVRSYVRTGLTNGTSYSFDVTSLNASGAGGVSLRTAVVTPATVPGAPVIGPASSGVAGGTINAVARWSAPGSTGGSAITGYRVYAYRMSSTGTVLATTVSPLVGPTLRAYAMTLPVVGSYRFAVRAVNAVGLSAYSARSNLVAGR